MRGNTVANGFLFLGRIYLDTGKFDQASNTYKEALRFSESLEDSLFEDIILIFIFRQYLTFLPISFIFVLSVSSDPNQQSYYLTFIRCSYDIISEEQVFSRLYNFLLRIYRNKYL